MKTFSGQEVDYNAYSLLEIRKNSCSKIHSHNGLNFVPTVVGTPPHRRTTNPTATLDTCDVPPKFIPRP